MQDDLQFGPIKLSSIIYEYYQTILSNLLQSFYMIWVKDNYVFSNNSIIACIVSRDVLIDFVLM